MSSEKDMPLSEEEQQESLLWEYLKEGEYDYQQPTRGEVRDGVILRKDAHQIIVDIGAKREGVVPASDLDRLEPDFVASLQVGDPISVYVLKPESQDGEIIVSINMARQMADWEEAEKLMEADEILEREVVGHNKGGLLVQVGQLQGFIPRSHIVDLNGRTKYGTFQERLSQMVGWELPLKIIEVNRRQRRLILSERAAWREWRAEQKKRLLADLEVGDVRTGTVTSLADFGAFVDLGGADGLVHLSELSWDRGLKPSELLRVGEEVEVKIISLDRERKRIGLSLKQLKPNPWATIGERYAIGQYIDVEVTNLAKFGAFARVEEGVEGLIHISELAEGNVQHPGSAVQPGQVLTVQILSLDSERKRIGLSLRRVPEHLRTPVEPPAAPAEVEAPAEQPDEAAVEETEMPEPVALDAGDDLSEAPAEQPDEAAVEETEMPEPAALDAGDDLSEAPAEEPDEAAVEETEMPEPAALDAGDDLSEAPAQAASLQPALASGTASDSVPAVVGVNGDNVEEKV